eukprot:1223134-Prymnesium_polylepis.1
MLTHDRCVQAAPQPRLVARLGLLTRLELLLELGDLHRHQVLLHNSHRRRRKEVLRQVRRVQLRPACDDISCRDREAARTSAAALRHDHTTTEAQQRHKHRGGNAAIRHPSPVSHHERQDHSAAARRIFCAHTQPRHTPLAV